jgi:hypothetical protein
LGSTAAVALVEPRSQRGAHPRADHATGTYVGKVEGIRPLGSEAAILRAVAGMVPAGRSDLEPELVERLTEELREELRTRG